MSTVKRITPDLLRTMPLPKHGNDADKDSRGRVLIVAGSRDVPGAALLSGVGALRAGAGKLQIATVLSVATHLGVAIPEAMVLGLPETVDGGLSRDAADTLLKRSTRCDATLIGPGMVEEEALLAVVTGLLQRLEPGCNTGFVLDAAAMAGLAQQQELTRRHEGRLILTPHAGEMASLMGISRDDVCADPLAKAREIATHLHCVVAMKGGTTHVVGPDGSALAYEEGTVGLATSGSGDVLAGIVTGLLARGAKPVEAMAWGTYLHGEAGNRLMRRHGGVGFLARELLAEVPQGMAGLPDQL